ncbi:MAG: twin-arginine translocation signal domain-containing protein [Planctomycetes bacterium]|nr:twin-arginine translocation signal domain-containing protein [Planctomycetota bacterium]
MAMHNSRRSFLKHTALGGLALGLGDLAFLSRLAPVSASEARLDPNGVRLRPEIEGLVRLLEETPREKLLEAVAARIRGGTSYQEVLAALLLAGVRNVEPRPSVGFKFHAVLVVNSAHLACLAGPDEDRWLPIFWALDYFKDSQERDVQEGNWRMAPVKDSALPPAHQAREAFLDAMHRWDEEAADVAVAALARTAGSNELFELFAELCGRDFRSIGHKAIFVANGFRTLRCIGWQHAEPVLRSLAYALLNHEGEPNPAESDLAPDRPWRKNEERIAKLPENWRSGRVDENATRELLAVLRTGSEDDACEKAVEQMAAGVSPQSVFDALFLGAGELLMRQPGIVGLHAVTTTNAMHYNFQTASNDETRKMLILQNAAFLPMFREAMKNRGRVRDAAIDELEATPPANADGEALGEIFADVSRNRDDAAKKTLSWLKSGGQAGELVDAARRLIFLKGTGSHDYKFSSAVLEDFYHVSPAWRDRFLATGMYNLKGSAGNDNSLVERTRAAFNA